MVSHPGRGLASCVIQSRSSFLYAEGVATLVLSPIRTRASKQARLRNAFSEPLKGVRKDVQVNVKRSS
jgi:hypothetical protein